MISGSSRFRPANRLNKPADYQSLFATGRRSGDRRFMFIARANGLEHARLGLAISKKNVSLAVKRNKLKRIIRESFRQHQDMLQGIDVVVLVKKEINSINDDEIFKVLQKYWKNVKK